MVIYMNYESLSYWLMVLYNHFLVRMNVIAVIKSKFLIINHNTITIQLRKSKYVVGTYKGILIK